MNQSSKFKIILSLILFGISVLLFSLGVRRYQVLTSSRAEEGITPTITGTATPTPTLVAGAGAGYTDFPNVEDNSYTPPLPLDKVTAAIREDAARAGGLCNIDTKQCTGWAWKYVCNVDPNIKWLARDDGDWSETEKHQLYNRHCTKLTGSMQDIGVTFVSMSAPAGPSQKYMLDDVGCGKLVQIDVTEGNSEPNVSSKEWAQIKDFLVYYTGSCPPPTATLTPSLTPTGIPTKTPTKTPIPTKTTTPTSTPTGTLTPSVTPTITLTPTITNTPTITPTPTATPSPTNTPIPTATLIPTATPIPTATLTPAPTSTQGPQATYTPQPTYATQPTSTPITKLAVQNQPPGITPWMVILLPIGLILIGLLL